MSYNFLTDANMKAAWLFDESSGNAADSSGNGHTATASGTITYSAAGKFNRCFGGNGSNSVLTAAASLDFRPDTGDFALGGWVYNPAGAAGLTCLINHGYGNTAGWMLYYYPSGAYCYIQSTDGGIASFDLPNSPQLTAGWNLIVTTRLSGDTKMYLNGTDQTLQDDNFNAQSMNYDGSLLIGNYSTYYFNRLFDEFFFMNRGITQAEVTAMNSYGLTGTEIKFFIGVS